MFCFGAFSGVYVSGNDIFEVMVALNLTVCDYRPGLKYLDNQ